MGKIKSIIIIVVLLVLLWLSQVIFSVLYSPSKDNHLGISSWEWTSIISSTWFEQQQLINFTNSKPTEITENIFDKYNSQCTYWKWNCNWFIGKDFMSSLSWLETIQYIAKDVDLTQPSDITNRFYDIHRLNPKRRYPHLFAQYIWPVAKKDEANKELSKISRENTIKIGEAWISYSCDKEKIERISKLNYQEFLQAIADHNPDYRYPCNTDELAHALAFNYYHYLNDVKKASLYYMVASFHDETPKITLSMPAIIEWREWNNKISAFLRYDRLQNNYKELADKDLTDDRRKQIEDNVNLALQKMVSELSLHILSKASLLAKEKKETDLCIYSNNCLRKNWYINNVISEIKTNCNKDKISCEILSLWEKSKRIKKSWELVYPISKDMEYAWDQKKSVWWIKIK